MCTFGLSLDGEEHSHCGGLTVPRLTVPMSCLFHFNICCTMELFDFHYSTHRLCLETKLWPLLERLVAFTDNIFNYGYLVFPLCWR